MEKRKPRPIEPTERLILEVPKGGNLDEVLRLLAAKATDGGSNAQVLTAINNLTNFVKENFMALKEDFQTLQSKFDGMESAVTAVADDIAALKSEIEEANERANIDLLPLVARADGIEAGLRAAVGSQPGSDPVASPPDDLTTDGE